MDAPPTLKQELQRYVRYYVSEIADRGGEETFEEADDFGIDDDDDEPDWVSEYQFDDLQEEEYNSGYSDLDGPEEVSRETDDGTGAESGDSGTAEGEGTGSGPAAEAGERESG